MLQHVSMFIPFCGRIMVLCADNILFLDKHFVFALYCINPGLTISICILGWIQSVFSLYFSLKPDNQSHTLFV